MSRKKHRYTARDKSVQQMTRTVWLRKILRPRKSIESAAGPGIRNSITVPTRPKNFIIPLPLARIFVLSMTAFHLRNPTVLLHFPLTMILPVQNLSRILIHQIPGQPPRVNRELFLPNLQHRFRQLDTLRNRTHLFLPMSLLL